MKIDKKAISGRALLETKNRNLRAKYAPTSSLIAANAHPRDTCKATIRDSAVTDIFIHDHPGRDNYPSKEGIILTKRQVQAGKVAGILVIDYRIGDGGHLRFKEKGLLQGPS